jgi:hypothetical protein
VKILVLILVGLAFLFFGCTSNNGSAGDDDGGDDNASDDDSIDDDTEPDDDSGGDKDDDGYQNDNCNEESSCCANAWVICDYLNPAFSDDCGESPPSDPWPPYRDYQICWWENLIQRDLALAGCGKDRGCEDWYYDRYMCWANDDYPLTVACYQSSDDVTEWVECTDSANYPDCSAKP